MKTFLVFCILFFSVAFINAQNGSKVVGGAPGNVDPISLTKTLILNTNSMTLKSIGDFKDELVSWKEKVISISINEVSGILTLIHNNLMNDSEFNAVLSKYGITKEQIISYK